MLEQKFLTRWTELGLEQILQERQLSNEAYQKKMAARLRAMASDYLQGKLKNILGLSIELGPVVREAYTCFGKEGMDARIREQFKNGVWGEHTELAVLAELLGVSLKIHLASRRPSEPVVIDLTAATDGETRKPEPEISLFFSGNHWSARIDHHNKPTLGDGNCAYNAVALTIQHLWQRNAPPRYAQSSALPLAPNPVASPAAPQTTIPENTQSMVSARSMLREKMIQEEKYWRGFVQSPDENSHLNAMPATECDAGLYAAPAVQEDSVQQQIVADGQLAWQIAEEEFASNAKHIAVQISADAALAQRIERHLSAASFYTLWQPCNSGSAPPAPVLGA